MPELPVDLRVLQGSLSEEAENLPEEIDQATADAAWVQEVQRLDETLPEAVAIQTAMAFRAGQLSVLSALFRHPALCQRFFGAPKLRFNELKGKVEAGKTTVSEGDYLSAQEKIEHAIGTVPTRGKPPRAPFPPESIEAAVRNVAFGNAYNPVKDYLESSAVDWDGEQRLGQAAKKLFGSAGTSESTMLQKWFFSAVERGLFPGHKADQMLVLAGPQSYGKSKFVRSLSPDGSWCAAGQIEMDDKAGPEKISRKWLYEMPEADHYFRGREAEVVKAFLSRTHDHFRAPYDREPRDYPRRCLVVGTTNSKAFLRDPSGSRRFWILRIERKIDLVWLNEFRDQLWGEATKRWCNESWIPTDEETEAFGKVAAGYQVEHPWTEQVRGYLIGREEVTLADILTGCLGLQTYHHNDSSGHVVRGILEYAGWVPDLYWDGKHSARRWVKR